MKPHCFLVSFHACGRLFAVAMALFLSGCATPSPVESIPSEFTSVGSSRVIQTSEEFLSEISGKPLRLLDDSIDASLIFNGDGTAVGLLTRDGGDEIAMELDWVWEGSAYCRTGSIGDSQATRKCESVTLFPDVGILLTYIDSDDPEEYWLFE